MAFKSLLDLNPASTDFAPAGGHWSPFGMGGPGQPGSLGKWDVLGNGLDRANPAQSKKPNEDTAAASGYLDTAAGAYNNIGTPTAVTPTAQTSSAGLDPQAQKAQAAQMAALSSLAANGGRSAASDANLAQIREQEGMQAQGLRGAAEQDAARRGMANGNSALLAKLSSNQAAENTGAIQGAQVAGQEANTALQAGQGAAGIGAGMNEQALQAAQARDTMARFNAGEDLSAQQYNSEAPIAQQLAVAGGKQKGAEIGEDYWSKKYAEDQKANSGMLGGILGAVGSAVGLSRGGEVPGPEIVSGDSRLNDIVPAKGPGNSAIRLSAHEVIVPKEMRSEDPATIASFVKNPPKASNPLNNRRTEARLAALAHLARK